MFDLAIGLILTLIVIAFPALLFYHYGFQRGRRDRSLEDFNTQHDDWYNNGFAEGAGFGDFKQAFAARYDVGWKAGYESAVEDEACGFGVFKEIQPSALL